MDSETLKGLLDVVPLIKKFYTEPPRAYHNWNHIQYGLNYIIDNIEELDATEEHILAWLFHDAIYIIGNQDNEADSAELARNILTPLNLSVDVLEIEKCILDTITHNPFMSKDSGLVLDLDLMVLGEEPEIYKSQYQDLIRKEYSEYSDADYAVGRIAFLEKALAKERLFFNDHFFERFEDQARINLNNELEQLKEKVQND